MRQSVMKLLVCGGRDFNDERAIFAALDAIHANRTVTLLIAGGAAGADALAEDWAVARGIPTSIHPAQWAKHGKSAGPIRNREMLALKPDGVVAFPGGRGTADCIRAATELGITVWRPLG